MSRNVTLCFVVACAAACAQDLMPVPSSMTRGTGKLAIGSGFRVAVEGYREPRLDMAARRLLRRLSRQTGIPLTGARSAAPTLVIECKGPGEKVQSPREVESYTLDVTPQQARIVAATPVGAMHGIETFLQLAMPDKDGFAVPVVRIDDKPRFPWRGLMIDSARHFHPIDVIERNLDAMAAVKLNVFHWHLSDNQGFRVESKLLPELHQSGSDGLFYTQAQVRYIVNYARERGIRVVPEFDMPGHTTAWFVGYPQLASGPGPYKIERSFGIFDPAIDPTRDEVYEFLDKLIGEMAALFPDPYFHVGGDEVNGKEWDANPRIQEFKRAHGIKTNEELQAYFNRRLFPLVVKHGKKMIGWDEVLDPSLPKEIMVQSWRGQKALADAARQGFEGILSNGYYLDLMFHASDHYLNDPLGQAAAGLNDAEKARILGGEACWWTELADSELMESRIWPRMIPIAERFWSPQEVRDLDSMYRRMEIQSTRLEWLGLRHNEQRRMAQERIAGYRPAGPVAALATALEPVKEYARTNGPRPYTVFTPLNRMVDATPPESVAARAFSKAVDALLAGDASQRDAIRRQAAAWRDQYSDLKQAFAESYLAAEVEPVSRDVAALGTAALEAVEVYLATGKPAPQSWAAEQAKLLERVKTPRAELLVVIAEPAAKLVKAAAR
ncbi:MAG: beta-N-acetylhexosaminidase [Acidobacteriota bacterium]